MPKRREDKSAQGNQRNERRRLVQQGMNPAEASRRAKVRHPLPDSQAKKKNNQPRGG